MEDKIKEAIDYAEGSTKLEGLNLTENEKKVVATEMLNEENDMKFIALVKKLVKKSDKEVSEEWQD